MERSSIMVDYTRPKGGRCEFESHPFHHPSKDGYSLMFSYRKHSLFFIFRSHTELITTPVTRE